MHGTKVERGQVRRSTQHRSHPGLPQADIFGMLAHISGHHIVIESQDRSKIHSCGKQIIPDLQKQCCERRARRSVGQMCQRGEWQRGSQCPERGTTPMLPHAVVWLQPALQLKGSGSASQQQSSRIPKEHWLSNMDGQAHGEARAMWLQLS